MDSVSNGSESPSSSRFKIVSSPPAVTSPLVSTKMNHVANISAPSASSPSPPPPPMARPSASPPPPPTLTTVEDAQPTAMEPRDAVVLSVPSIELPDGKKKDLTRLKTAKKIIPMLWPTFRRCGLAGPRLPCAASNVKTSVRVLINKRR
jgi:hypothetical protein